MRKKGFTLLEVVLAVTLFGLMIGVILQAYTSIQLGNVKVIDTQKTIEVSENLFERLNDMTTDYVINTEIGLYSGNAQIINNGNTNIIYSNILRLKPIGDENNNHNIVFKKECNNSGLKCKLQMDDKTTEEVISINLSKYDEVNVDYLNFEIYPDQQYVNINIKTSIPGGETLQSGDGIRLTTTVGFKTYEKYDGELTAETLCEDVCSISQISNTGMKQSTINMANNGNNITNDACTLGVYKSNNNSIIFGILDGWFNIFGNHNYDHKDIYTIADNCNKTESSRCRSHCNKNKPGTNPYNCGYIRNTISSPNYDSFRNSGHQGQSGCQIYNEYVMNTACEDMCKASIFSCIDDYEDPLIKRTGIKIETGEHAGEYLQNPKLYELSDSGNYNNGIWSGENGWKCDTGTLTRKSNSTNILEGFFLGMFGLLEHYWTCNKNGIIYCDGTYYGNSNNESAIMLTDEEHDKNCIKWTRNQNNTSQPKSGIRYVYTNEESQVGTSCVCKVDYTYSLNAGGYIESGSCGGLRSVLGEGYEEGKDGEDYIPKEANLIYITGMTDLESKSRSDIKNNTGLKSRVGINSIILDTNCNNYNNGVCTTSARYNNKNYKIAGESGMYTDSYTTWSNCSCSNPEYYDCVGNCTCADPAIPITIYLTGHNMEPAKGWYCLNVIANDTGITDDGSGGKRLVIWTGLYEHGECKVYSGVGCIGGEQTGYSYVNFESLGLNSEGLRRRYCGTNDRSGGGYLNGREGMVGNQDSDLTNGENSRYSGYTYYCKKKTDECRIYTDYEITPRWYCENILDLGTWGNYRYGVTSASNKPGCRYCKFTGEAVPITQTIANNWYCYEFKSGIYLDNNKCVKDQEITYDETVAKQYYCEKHDNYRYDNECYTERVCTNSLFGMCLKYNYSNQIRSDIAKQYYCTNKLKKYWYDGMCHEIEDLDNKSVGQQYCTGYLGLNRDNKYECRKESTGCIDENEYEEIPGESFDVRVVLGTIHFTGINDEYLTNNNKKNICNNDLNKPRKTDDITTYDPFRFRWNSDPQRPNYEWDNSTNQCKYCYTYRNAYTGVLGYNYTYTQEIKDKNLQELRCNRKHNQDERYNWDGTGCYTGVFTTCEKTGIIYDKIDLTGEDDFYDEAYCNSGVINGSRVSLGANNSSAAATRSGNICLNTSEGIQTCILGTNLSGWIKEKTGYIFSSYKNLNDRMNDYRSNDIAQTELNSKIIKYKGKEYYFYLGEDKGRIECLGGKSRTNVYKDYNHTCEMSITQQSNNILNIIDSISKNRRTSTVDYSDVPRYLRWTIR